MKDGQVNIDDAFDKALGKYNQNPELGMFMAGISAMTFGGVIGTFLPAYHTLSLGSYAIGGLSIVLHFIDKYEGKWDKIFKSLGLYVEKENKEKILPKKIKKRETEYGYELMVTLPLGLTSEDFEKKKLAMEQHLNAKIDIEYKNKHIFLKIFDKNLEYFHEYKFVKTNHPLEILIGINEENQKPIVEMLTDQKTNLMIGGQIGGGKTNFILQITTNIINNILYSGNDIVDIHILSSKKSDFIGLKECGCKQVKNIIGDIEEMNLLFRNLIKEMNARYKIFENFSVSDIWKYNTKSKDKKMKHIMVFIDEFADISLYLDKELQKYMIHNIYELVRRARAAGIHVIPATQRPDKDAIPSSIKSQLPLKFGFKTNSKINSNVILDDGDCSKLRGNGHGLMQYGGITEFQAMYIDKDNIKKYILTEAMIKELKNKEDDKNA